jgi:hypothetical protein
MAGVGKPKLRPSLISFIGQILKIRFGGVNNFRFQILKGYSSYRNFLITIENHSILKITQTEESARLNRRSALFNYPLQLYRISRYESFL